MILVVWGLFFGSGHRKSYHGSLIVSNVPVNQQELDQFKISIDSLCRSFGVFIKNKSIRRDSPTAPDFYYELELSIKVRPNGKGTPDFNDQDVCDLIEASKARTPLDK